MSTLTEPQPLSVSIIIPVYNGQNSLPDTLRSILNLDGECELIVVDDASTDNTAALSKEAGAQVLTMPHNVGPATARNRGAQAANGNILLFTDSDVLLPKSLLKDLRHVFTEIKCDAVQGTFSDVCPYGNFFSQYKNLYNRFVLNQLPDWIDTTFTSITAVKKGAFQQCGGFDENIRGASVEDRTLGRNLRKHGFSTKNSQPQSSSKTSTDARATSSNSCCATGRKKPILPRLILTSRKKATSKTANALAPIHSQP